MDNSVSVSGLAWRERPLRELARLAWPIALSQISLSFMIAVDTLFVGRLGSAALAGVALGGTTTFTVFCFAVGLLRATKIVVAQAVGAGRSGEVRAQLGASLVVALGLGCVIALIGHGIAACLPAFAASAASGELAASYARVRMWGAPTLLVGVALRETRQALGDAQSPMRATLIANVLNFGLVAAAMLWLGAGVEGVAWATTLAQLVEALILAYMQRAHGFGLRAWSSRELRALLRLGVPLGIERFFDVASFSLMVWLFARMGDRDLAAHQVAAQCLIFVFMPAMAIGDATCVLIGQAFGAGSLRTVPHVQRAALVLGFGYVAVCSAGMAVFGAQLAGVFVEDVAVTARASELLAIAAVFVWCIPFYHVGQSSLRGLGEVHWAAWITVLAAWGCTPLLAAALGIGLGMGAPGGWIGLGLEIALASALYFWRLRQREGAQPVRTSSCELRPV